MTLKIKDPGSALTHFIAMILALCASSPLIMKAAREPGASHVLALSIFITSMVLLYAASTIYHTLDISPRINRILRKADHMMIFILIAGTYTPVCMLVLGDRTGWILLALVWGIAILGILMNALWINCPKWLSSLVYIAMGWVCVLAFGKIIAALPRQAFGWPLLRLPRNFPPVCDGRQSLPLYYDVCICCLTSSSFSFLLSCLISHSRRMASCLVLKLS